MRAAILHLKKADPVMKQIIESVVPYRIQLREPTFETLARSIVYQQVSGKAAASIFARVRKAAGPRFTARSVLRLKPEELRACGLSNQKATYMLDLAEHVVTRKINFKRLMELPDDDVIEQLTRVKGIGVWTVQMFLIFALERLDILPLADLGVRNAVYKAYGLPEHPKPADLVRIAEKWRPYCSVATWYLWRSLDGPAAL